MTKILCFDISKLDLSEYTFLYNTSTNLRKEKADRLKNHSDKVRCIVAGALLEYALKTWLLNKNIAFDKEMLETSENTHGKPFLSNVKRFYYNLSHCDKWVVLGYGDSEIGVDIEKISENSKETRTHLAQRCFTENEKSYLFEKDELFAKRFIEIWSGKESYLKYKGTGIASRLSSADVIKLKSEGLVSIFFDNDFYLSYFSEEKNVSIDKVDYNTILLK